MLGQLTALSGPSSDAFGNRGNGSYRRPPSRHRRCAGVDQSLRSYSTSIALSRILRRSRRGNPPNSCADSRWTSGAIYGPSACSLASCCPASHRFRRDSSASTAMRILSGPCFSAAATGLRGAAALDEREGVARFRRSPGRSAVPGASPLPQARVTFNSANTARALELDRRLAEAHATLVMN
jgi:hypothetical protein